MSTFKGNASVITSAVLFGTMPIFAKYLFDEGCNSTSLAFYRFFLCLPILFTIARIRNKNMGFTLDELKKMIILGSWYVITPLLLFTSYSYLTAGAASIIHFVYPVFVLLGCVVVFKEKITNVKIIGCALCCVGLVMFYSPGENSNLLGVLLSFTSGFTFGAYIVYLDKSGLKNVETFKLSFYLSLICTIMLFVYAVIRNEFVVLTTPRGWGLAVLFSFTLCVVAMGLFQIGVKYAGPQNTAILSTFEPITSVALGVWLFHEEFTIKTFIGVVTILSAVIIITLFDKKSQRS